MYYNRAMKIRKANNRIIAAILAAVLALSCLAACGKKVCYPVVKGRGIMMPFAPDPGDPAAWRTGAFGIREPVEKKSASVSPEEIDAVLVPCTAFDRRGGRCGHGAGYYDRYLAGLPAGVPKILVAFDVQETEEVAVDENDIKMNLAVTESSVYRIEA